MYFLHQIKHNSNTDAYDKGIVVKETYEAAKQSYHAYLGAYAYGQNAPTDFVSCFISDEDGINLMAETWRKPYIPPEPEPEPEPEPTPVIPDDPEPSGGDDGGEEEPPEEPTEPEEEPEGE